jgi:hypothetical protein
MALLRRNGASGQVECGDKFRRVRVDQTVETAEVKTIYRDLLGIPHVRFELNLEHPYRGVLSSRSVERALMPAR